MVKIVTGKINSYKTTRLQAYYNEHLMGDGFVAIKTMDGSLVHHYDLVKLSTNESVPYIVRDLYLDKSLSVKYQIGPYCMLESACSWVENQIQLMIDNKVSPIYLDEIGLLELKGLGFAGILEKLLKLNIDLCLVVRQDLLESVIKYFQIKKFEIIGDAHV